jgi:acetoin utilization deacetylase AcuC-like enzyme
MYVIYDDFYLKHSNGPGHPENPNRLVAIKGAIDGWDLKDRIAFGKPRPATDKEIGMVHDEDYIQEIKDLSEMGGISYLDPDTAVTEYTYDCSLLAAGGCFEGLDLIFDDSNKSHRFFAVIRPPGHHAFKNHGGGFCIFNNAALSARYAQIKYGIKKIAIIDFDAHHGNGTQDFFYNDGSVFYISFHQYPHYPGTGNFSETGRGRGTGFNMNFPFMAETGDPDYVAALLDIIIPVMEKFDPELFLVSAGYDSHYLDTLSSLSLAEESYYKIMYIISYLSHKHCRDRIGILLEGGYEYNATARSVLETIRGCFENKDLPGTAGKSDLENRLEIDRDFLAGKIKNTMVLDKVKEIFKI